MNFQFSLIHLTIIMILLIINLESLSVIMQKHNPKNHSHHIYDETLKINNNNK